jgi:hypothetical protein
MLIQLLAKLAVVCFVTITFELGATVTHAIFHGTLVGVLAFDSLLESPEIDDVAHDDSKPPLPSALPPGSRLKVRDDRTPRFGSCIKPAAAPSSQRHFKLSADRNRNMSDEIQFNGPFLSFTR